MAVFLSILIAVAVSVATYLRTKELEISLRRKVALATLRFFYVFIIAFILFSPLMRLRVRVVEKPQLYLALDMSKSMSGDSVAAVNGAERLSEELREKFNVKELSFGKSVYNGFSGGSSDNATDFSALFDKISLLQNPETPSAVIILTDGNYNYGASPLYSYQNVSLPFYAIAFGDTSVYPDISISRVNNNKYAYLNNLFPVEVSVEMNNMEFRDASVSVFHEGKKIEERTLVGSSVQFDIKADKAGLQAYTVIVSSINGEKNTKNNSRTFYIEVLDGKQKILILAAAPHPDISAIRHSLESGDMFETSLYVGKEVFNGLQNLDAYNLVFLHGLPSIAMPLRTAVLKEKSLFVIISESTDLNAMKELNTGFDITLKSNAFSEAVAERNTTFGLFSISKEDEEVLKQFPPLNVPFGVYTTTTASGETFLTQKVLGVSSENPLLWFSVSGGRGVGVFSGSGIFRWSLNNYFQKQNTAVFDDIMIKAVQLLANRANKEPLVVRHPRYFYEQTPIVLNAELYNSLFEAMEDEKVSISIYDSNGQEYPYTFSPHGKFYYLNTGYLPVGEYKYTAKAKVGNKELSKSGAFSIIPLQLEDIAMPANITFLRDMAMRYNGAVFAATQVGQMTQGMQDADWVSGLVAALENRLELKSQIRYEERLHSLVELWWIWLLLVILLGSEWFLRKYSAGVI